MNNCFKIFLLCWLFAHTATAQSSFTFALGGEVSFAQLYKNNPLWIVYRVDRYNKRPVLVLSAEYQKYLGKTFGLGVTVQATSNYKLGIDNAGIADYDHFQFKVGRLMIQGKYKPIKHLEIEIGPCLNYTYQTYRVIGDYNAEERYIRPPLELAGGCSVSWIQKQCVLSLQGLYAMDGLIQAPEPNYYLKPLRTLSLGAAYRLYR